MVRFEYNNVTFGVGIRIAIYKTTTATVNGNRLAQVLRIWVVRCREPSVQLSLSMVRLFGRSIC